MTIGSSPFLTADVDETFGFPSQWPAQAADAGSSGALSARLELIRRRVLTGYYSSPVIATELARRLLERDSLQDK